MYENDRRLVASARRSTGTDNEPVAGVDTLGVTAPLIADETMRHVLRGAAGDTRRRYIVIGTVCPDVQRPSGMRRT